MRFNLNSKKEKPPFNFFIRNTRGNDYWLYKNLEEALEELKVLSISRDGSLILHEVCYDPFNADWRSLIIFSSFYGNIVYQEEKRLDLHVEYYMKIGEWMNPNEGITSEGNTNEEAIDEDE